MTKGRQAAGPYPALGPWGKATCWEHNTSVAVVPPPQGCFISPEPSPGLLLSASQVLVTSQRKAPGLQKELISRRLTDRREKRLAAYPLLYLAGDAA